MTTRLARLQKTRRSFKHEIIQKNGWLLFSPYVAKADIETETLEELEILHDLNPIDEIRNHLDRETYDYSDDLRIYIR